MLTPVISGWHPPSCGHQPGATGAHPAPTQDPKTGLVRVTQDGGDRVQRLVPGLGGRQGYPGALALPLSNGDQPGPGLEGPPTSQAKPLGQGSHREDPELHRGHTTNKQGSRGPDIQTTRGFQPPQPCLPVTLCTQQLCPGHPQPGPDSTLPYPCLEFWAAYCPWEILGGPQAG